MNNAQVSMKPLVAEEVKALADEIRRAEAGSMNAVDRHARNADACAIILRDKDLAIYERLLEMDQSYATQFMRIVDLERKLHEECQHYLAQHGAE
jgi:hypothetical protein